jgi:hypothetical protein
VPPRLVTPRTPSRDTDGDTGAFIAHLHGRPWLPWQRAAADLIGERLPNGRYAYPIVVVLVPRQCGKTTWALDVAQGRCLAEPDFRAAYTAQTGQAATERFLERIAALPSNALSPVVKTRRSAGSERMTFPGGSYLKAFPPKDAALRGYALDLVIVDEPQEIDQAQGVALDQTILPTFTTRPRRQLILCGTAGTDKSRFLARYLDMARAGMPGVAVIEYGADPAADPTDPAVWHAVHPGLAAGLTDDDALSSALSVLGASGFAREYLNVWQSNQDRTIEPATWAACRRRDAAARPGVPPVFGVDVSIDRAGTAIVAAWPDVDGTPVLELVEYAPGVAWAAGRLTDLHTAHGAQLWIDGGTGPAGTIAAALTGKPWVHTLTGRDLAAASAGLLDALTDQAVSHRGEPAMDKAAAGAVRRPTGDGWIWGRRTATADVAPIMAAALALYGHARRPNNARPRVITDTQ